MVGIVRGMEIPRFLLDEVETWKDEIETKRRKRKDRWIVPEEDRPESAIPICPYWKGGWLYLRKEGRLARTPLGCGARYCEVCGPKKIFHERQELQQGYYEKWGVWPAKMGTVTYRARLAEFDRWGFVRVESWEEFRRRTGGDLTLRLPKWYDSLKLHEVREWWLEWPPYDRVVLRSQLRPQQWMKLLTSHWQAMRAFWLRTYGAQMDYASFWELTKQGTPHMHLAYPVPKALIDSGMGWYAIHAVLLNNMRIGWGAIVGEDRDEVQVHVGEPEYYNSETAISYIHKYAAEVGEIVSREYAKGRAQLLGYWEELDWNYKIRRLRKSDSWPRADIGDESAFLVQAGYAVNRREWKRRLNLARYHAITTGNLEKAQNAPSGSSVISWKPRFVQDGLDSFGVPKWKREGMQPASRAGDVLEALAHWHDAKEVMETRGLNTEVLFPEKQPKYYLPETDFPWFIRVQLNSGELISPRGQRYGSALEKSNDSAEGL